MNKEQIKEQIKEQRESIKKEELVVEGLDAVIISLTNAKNAINTKIALSNNLLHVFTTEEDSIDKATKLLEILAELMANQDDLNKKVALAITTQNEVGDILSKLLE